MEIFMIEYAGLFYVIVKDIANFCKSKNLQNDDRTITNKWLIDSGFKTKLDSDGYDLRWTNPSKIPERQLLGYETMYQIDESNKKIYRLKNKSGDILLGKKP